MKAALLGQGLVCALGSDVDHVRAQIAAGHDGLTELEEDGWPTLRGGRVQGPSLKGLLKRRKDRKLLPRAATLALPAAVAALGQVDCDPEEIGLFVAVRREPADTGEADASIAASLDPATGTLSVERLAGRGRDLYPPLLPLRTLPNMVLAHVSINLALRGPADTRAGGPDAGVQALRMGIQAVAEGRCPLALVVAADSWVDAGSLRDHARLGRTSPPGEAAAAVLIGPARQSGPHVVDCGAGAGQAATEWGHWSSLGQCGAADPLLALVLGAQQIRGVGAQGAWAAVARSGPGSAGQGA
jgi:3-oxoacyl-(acyl-carrier-protein) synthase